MSRLRSIDAILAPPRLTDLRLAIPAVAVWIVTGVLVGVPGAATPTTVCAAGIACSGLVLSIFARWWRRDSRAAILVGVTVVAAFVSLAALSTGVHDGVRHPATWTEARDHPVVADAVVSAGAVRSSGTWLVTLLRLDNATRTIELSVDAVVFDGVPESGVDLGARYAISGSLRATDPGDDVAFLFFADGPATRIADPSPVVAWANGLRGGLSSAAGKLSGSGAALLPGLAIGDTSEVDANLDAAMKSSALSHLTAVSGANCAVVVALVMGMGAALRAPRAARVAVALVGDPVLSRSYGFALSVLATAGILVLARPLASAASRVLPRPIAITLSVPLAAQIACQPVLILLNPSIPVFGLFANVVAAPAAPIATILGLVACVLLPLIPPVGQIAVVLAWIPAIWIASIAEFTASLPAASLPWPPGEAGLASLTIVTVGGLAAALGGSRRVRIVGAAVALIAVFAVSAAAVAVRVSHTAGRPADWQIAVCDVGQGDAIVVRSAGRIALIDTGPDPAVLSSCLDDLGVSSIDLLVLTHFDLDHVGGIAAVEGSVARAIIGPSGGSDDNALARDLTAAGTHVERVTAGATGQLGELRWRVLWPLARGGFPPGNPSSVVTHFEPVGECESGCLSALFLGDLGEESQRAMVRASNPGRVAVVGVAHHGSADQYSPLYARIGATVGVIGVGADNRYGHPTDSLLEALVDAGTAARRTDNDGLVLIAPRLDTDGSGVTIWTAHGGDGAGG